MHPVLAALYLETQRIDGLRHARERRIGRPASIRRRHSRSARPS